MKSNKLYPLKFRPILKEMLWGGKKIPKSLNIDVLPDVKIGESYTISGLLSDPSIIENGSLKGDSLPKVIELHGEALLGKEVYNKFNNTFPLLIKFIDANDDLSVQVHPNDTLALQKHQSLGKTEMWYVMEADQGATLISGLKYPVTPNQFISRTEQGTLQNLLNYEFTKEGDCYFIPAGRVHSIGKGNVIAEIQQTSNITYRIYDFNRTDKLGNKRELHVEAALEALGFKDTESGKVRVDIVPNKSVNLVECQYFTTNIIEIEEAINMDYTHLNSFVIYINVGNDCSVEYDGAEITLNRMEAILIPACIDKMKIKTRTGTKVLEVFMK